MFFPTLDTLATKNVIYIDRDQSISSAVALMSQHNIRNVIIRSIDDYYILTASDLIRFKVEDVSYDTALSQVPLCRVPQVLVQTNVLDAIDLFVDGVDYLCLIDDGKRLVGIVSYTDLAMNVDPEIFIKTQRVGDLIDDHLVKAQIVVPTLEVFEEMMARNQSAAIIFDGLNAIGILTQKDVINLLSNGQPINLPVSKYMSLPLISIPDSFTLQEALKFSQENRLKRIVVKRNDGTLLGICNQKDLITTAYGTWAKLVREHHQKLKELGEIISKRESGGGVAMEIDRLTGVYNFRMFGEFFVRELAQKRRYKTPLSLIVLNLDHFKSVNDSCGHIVGDGVLKRVARITLDKTRASDIVARRSGGEFVVLLPNTPQDGAKTTAEKIRKEIANGSFEIPMAITASFGVAEVADNDSLDGVLQRALGAMMEAKNNGRNQVFCG